MRNSFKVAKWEIKRNMKNKSFIISLLLTPLIFMFFFFVPSLFGDSEPDTSETITVYVLDELHIWNELEAAVTSQAFLNWNLQPTELNEASMNEKIAESEQTVFIPLTEESLEQGQFTMYVSEDVNPNFVYEASILEKPLRQLQIERLGLTAVQQEVIARGITLEPIYMADHVGGSEEAGAEKTGEADPLRRIVPGAFAGIILFSIVMTGMMIFQSASQEKKEKVAEIILSSLTPTELMQGKIIGYFVLGITQVLVWLAFAFPLVMWKLAIPVWEYLVVPELALLLLIAVAGYLMFSAIFVGLGATVEDLTATSNFQGIVMMLPFLPFLFIGPVFNDPSGLIAKIGTFIPFTAPGILLMRLSILDEWPWLEIILALVVLGVSIWLLMKLAGKIFKMGILMYGKNATIKEIWKWIWA